MRQNGQIIDTTLREGEQSPGVLFTLSEKKTILDHLVKIGIDEVEIGISSKMHPCPGPLIDYCREHHSGLRLSLWSRCRKEDIIHASTLQPDLISLSVPVSDLHLRHKIRKDRSWAMNSMVESIRLANKKGLAAAVGFEDATRADLRFLTSMALAAERAGADRIRLADTVGIYSPGQTTSLVYELKRKLASSCTLAFHAHNDFGMATANSIAALEAGAEYVDAVVLGLGERTGCARLEEVAGFLSLARNNPCYKPEYLKPLANFITKLICRPIPGNRPIIGDEIFTCETGLHIQGLQSMPETYEPFSPNKVRAKRKLQFGAKSGRRGLEEKLRQLGVTDLDKLSENAVEHIRTIAAGLKRPLSDPELLQLVSATR